jgi:sugar lactone lactonase YvrE
MPSPVGKTLNRSYGIALAFVLVSTNVLAQQPRIDSVSPSQGPIAGGTVVTVNGSRLAGATIKLDRDGIAPLAQSDTQLTLVMPKHENGYVQIVAANSSGVAIAEYLYIPPRLADLPPGSITTIAGVGKYTREFGPANQTPLDDPVGVAFDKSGNLFIGEAGGNRILRVDVAGTIERYAGTGTSDQFHPGDGGPALDAEILFPKGIAVDSGGNLFIGDQGESHRVRRVDAATHIITTVAGDGTPGFSGDGGPAAQARVNHPTYVAVAPNGELSFIDFGNMRVRRISPSGIITTVAGIGQRGFSGDGGPAASAAFSLNDTDLGSLAVDAQGNLFLADFDNHRIRKIDRQTGIITTVLGPDDPFGHVMNDLNCVAIGADGSIYLSLAGIIERVEPNGHATRWGVASELRFAPDGTAASTAALGSVFGLTLDANENIVFADQGDGRVRRINVATGKLETLAGIGPRIPFETGPAVAATLVQADALAFLPNGDLLVDDALHYRIRRITPAGMISNFAGADGVWGKVEEVPALQATVGYGSMVVDRFGNVFIVGPNNMVRRIDSSGIIHRVAGSTGGLSGDGGPARNAQFQQPWDLSVDDDGNIFVADTNNNRIRRIDAGTNIITTVAGTGPSNGVEGYGRGKYCGDGGPAVQACLNSPFGVQVGPNGYIYISDGGNARIRRIDPAGIISTFIEGGPGFRMIFDGAGFLYGGSVGRVLRVSGDGTRFETLAGTGELIHSGDGGPATQARILGATDTAIDADGNLFFTEDNRVRAIRYGAVLASPNATIQATAAGSFIRATVLDAAGHPAPSVRVDFASPSSGASCTLSSPFAITDANGIAVVTCTSNCIAGTYSVIARPVNGSAVASVAFTNGSGPCRRRAAQH